MTAVIKAKYKSEFEHTKNTPYLALTGELWDVFCENFGENQHSTVLSISWFLTTRQTQEIRTSAAMVLT